MISSNPVTLGILWSCCILQLLLPTISGQNTNKESHRVYSYTYHFQHNGTNPKDILQEILAGPDFAGEDRSVIKTISHPSLRGFVTKGILPSGPPNSFNRGVGYGAPRDVSIDDIKKFVQGNIPQLPPPPPLPPIPPAPVDFTGNFLNNGGLQDLQQVARPIDRNHVVTNQENFVRNTPAGRIEGKTETFSYNPPPINNAINNIQGFRKSEQIVSHDQQSRGHVTQSYFRQSFNKNSQDDVNPGNVFGQRITPPGGLNGNNEWWKQVRDNIANNIGNFNRGQENKFNSAPNFHSNNAHQNNVNNEYGRQINRQYENQNFERDRPNFNNHRPAITHNRNNPNPAVNQRNWNFVNDQASFDRPNPNPVHPGNYENHGNTDFGRNNNHQVQRNGIAENSPVIWDDKRNDVINSENFGEYGNRLSRNVHHDRNHFAEPNRNNIRPFSNGHSGPSQNHQVHSERNNQLPLQNPADFLKSTLEALIPGSKALDIPPFSNNGNYRHSNNGGQQRVYGSDVITRGPNSFSRQTERGYHRNFETTSNNEYQTARRWSTENIRRLDTDSSKNEFNKDFIDVFQDDYSN